MDETMENLRPCSWMLIVVLFLSATISQLVVLADTSTTERKVYIVYMGGPPKVDFSLESVHLHILAQVLEGSSPAESLVHHYKKSFSGFAARLTEQEKKKLIGMEGVVSVFPSRTLQLHTTRSWDFLGFPTTVKRIPSIESNIIIGVIDSGIWPESECFSDKGFGPPPSKWKGICQNLKCNNKIIGARFYNTNNSYSPEEEKSPHDIDGHGTHTASTAASGEVKNASLFGLAKGTLRGAVPSARIAVYKVCWKSGCADYDVMAAFDDAISDGVDILSISLGSSDPQYFTKDVMAIGAFHAMQKGILTSVSAGNAGPLTYSIQNNAPWMLTVAASSIDRRFVNNVTLGNNITFLGHAVNSFPTQKEFFPFIHARDAANDFSRAAASSCLPGSLNRTLVKGKTIFCDIINNGIEPFLAGAQGMVVSDGSVYDDVAFSDPLPTAPLNLTDAKSIELYLNTGRNTTAQIFKSETIHDLEAPKVASFSSRGPNIFLPNIFKPDISAPGVDILAAWSPKASVSSYNGDKRSTMYNIISGTSMACPHATGAAAYVKTFHPTWSPAAIKSALMTTASSMTVRVFDNGQNELAYGAGQIDPIKAVNPGLVYDTLEADYIEMFCELGADPEDLKIITGKNITCVKHSGTDANLNYPAMTDGARIGKPFERIHPRTVTNVGFPNSTYKATIGAQPLLNVTVTPNILSFKSLNEKQKFIVDVSSSMIPSVPSVISTELVWSDGFHKVRSPIAIWTYNEE